MVSIWWRKFMTRKRICLLTLCLACLTLCAAPLQGSDAVELRRQGNRIEVRIGGRPFTTYYFGPESPKPYLHPLRSAQGTIVNRGIPIVKNIAVGSHDHPHHGAIFFSHRDVHRIR